jgi:DNA-binding NarL/FixJ family response regulator
VTALKLLIADDDPDDARLIAYQLKCAGYAVEWQRVDDETGFVRGLAGAALVICDLSMPRFSPVRALEVIRELGLGTPLVLVSGSISADCARRIMQHGAAGYCPKDQLKQLGQTVRTVLAGIDPSHSEDL